MKPVLFRDGGNADRSYRDRAGVTMRTTTSCVRTHCIWTSPRLLRNDILSQALEPHTRLPSEPELSKRFGAARATVRRALAKLQEEGLIYAKQKVGSFVAEPRVEQDLDQLVSFTQFMVYRGMKPSSKLITAAVQKVEDPHSPLLHYPGLRAGAKVVYIRRLRLGGRQPLVIANTWLPESRFPGVIKHNL